MEFSALVTVPETVILSFFCLLQQRGLWFEPYVNISELSSAKYIKKTKCANRGELTILYIHNYAQRKNNVHNNIPEKFGLKNALLKNEICIYEADYTNRFL